jgi:hypothetical protein
VAAGIYRGVAADPYFAENPLLLMLIAALIVMAALPLMFLLEIVGTGLWGATLGKWIFRLRLRMQSGERVPFRTAFKRGFTLWIKSESAVIAGLIVLFFLKPQPHYGTAGHNLRGWGLALAAIVTVAFWIFQRPASDMREKGETSWDRNCRTTVVAAYPTSRKRIGGWLAVFAFGLVCYPVRQMATVALFLAPFAPLLASNEGDNHRVALWLQQVGDSIFTLGPGDRLLAIYILAQAIILAVFAIVVAVFFFLKSHRAPRLVIAFLAADMGTRLVTYGFAIWSPAVKVGLTNVLRDALVLVLTVIWIRYFLVSKRVRNTFGRHPSAVLAPEQVPAA